MADPWSRYQIINSTGAAAASLTSDTFTSPLRARLLTLTVRSDRDCTLALQVLEDDGSTWMQVQTETVTGGTNDVYVYNGNYSACRVVLTAVGSSAWNAAVYGQAS